MVCPICVADMVCPICVAVMVCITCKPTQWATTHTLCHTNTYCAVLCCAYVAPMLVISSTLSYENTLGNLSKIMHMYFLLPTWCVFAHTYIICDDSTRSIVALLFPSAPTCAYVPLVCCVASVRNIVVQERIIAYYGQSWLLLFLHTRLFPVQAMHLLCLSVSWGA